MATEMRAQRTKLRTLCWRASELIAELDRMYPARTPNLDAPERQLWADIGARKLVELLIQLRGEGENDAGGVFATH